VRRIMKIPCQPRGNNFCGDALREGPKFRERGEALGSTCSYLLLNQKKKKSAKDAARRTDRIGGKKPERRLQKLAHISAKQNGQKAPSLTKRGKTDTRGRRKKGAGGVRGNSKGNIAPPAHKRGLPVVVDLYRKHLRKT